VEVSSGDAVCKCPLGYQLDANQDCIQE
jgi:hypothetical protein